MSAKTRIPKECLSCGGTFEPPTALLRKGYGKFCDKRCYGAWLSRSVDRKEMARRGSLSKGHTVSMSVRERISQANRGRKRPDVAGMLSPFWKGGVNTESMRIRRSSEYLDWRRQVFERNDYRCVECGARSGIGEKVYLEADHIKSFADFPALRLEVSNGRTLCRPCHMKTSNHGRRKKVTI